MKELVAKVILQSLVNLVLKHLDIHLVVVRIVIVVEFVMVAVVATMEGAKEQVELVEALVILVIHF